MQVPMTFNGNILAKLTYFTKDLILKNMNNKIMLMSDKLHETNYSLITKCRAG